MHGFIACCDTVKTDACSVGIVAEEHLFDLRRVEGPGVGMIGGPIGTKVRLELLNPERKEKKTVELTRRKLQVSS